MDLTEESLVKEDRPPEKDEAPKNTGWVSPEDDPREFEQFLMDIGLRF